MFTARQYIEYLIATTGNYACTNLADHLEGDQAVSHDTLSADLRCEKLTPHGLGEVVESPINDSPTADLLLDDSVQDKRYATKIEFVYRQWSGADPGVVGGVGVVNLVHASGPGRAFYSIDYWIYDPEGGRKTK